MAIDLKNLLISNTTLRLPIKLHLDVPQLLSELLGLNIGFVTDPRSALHELGSLKVGRLHKLFKSPDLLLEELVVFGEHPSLSLSLVVGEDILLLESSMVVLGSLATLLLVEATNGIGSGEALL